MVVLLGAIAIIVVAFNVLRPDPELPEPIDYVGVAQSLDEEYPYALAVPSSVPGGWTATSVDHHQDVTGHRWRVGFLVDGDGFVGLEQSDGEIQSYLLDRMADFDGDGTSTIDGVAWDRMRQDAAPHDQALVLVDDDVVTIVRGTVSYTTLEDFASRLVTQ
jgi:hypothetical protein